MIKITGYSDDIVDIVGSDYKEDEIGCYDADVRIWFTDGTVIRIGYGKPVFLGIWYIIVEKKGTAEQSLVICDDENAEVYSDVFSVDAEIIRHEVMKKQPL